MPNTHPTEHHGDGEGGHCRREFLKRSIAIAAAAALARRPALFAQELPRKTIQPLGSSIASRPRVIRLTPERVMPLGAIQQPFLRNALADGLCRFTGAPDAAEAWRRILSPEDVILLKFNRSAATTIGTTALFATTLVESLTAAGWAPDQIVLLEADAALSELRQVRRADMRWQGREIDFGSCGKDSFIAALDQATALINVPFLKTHNLATMTGCLKNLSHGLIRHPARFHSDGCDPAIAEIVASDPIRKKLKLNIVNALRVVFQDGPDAHEDRIHTFGTVLLGTDPVACDAIGYNVLNEVRSLRGLGPLMPTAKVPKQLVTAAKLGVGQADVEQIEVEAT